MAGKARAVSEGGGWKRKLLIDEEDDGEEVATPGARAVGSIISETVYDIINREGDKSEENLSSLCTLRISWKKLCVCRRLLRKVEYLRTGRIENKYNYNKNN